MRLENLRHAAVLVQLLDRVVERGAELRVRFAIDDVGLCGLYRCLHALIWLSTLRGTNEDGSATLRSLAHTTRRELGASRNGLRVRVLIPIHVESHVSIACRGQTWTSRTAIPEVDHLWPPVAGTRQGQAAIVRDTDLATYPAVLVAVVVDRLRRGWRCGRWT